MSPRGKGIWGRLTTTDRGGGGVWGEVDIQLANHASTASPLDARMSIWQVLQTQPGGLWQDLDDETMISDASISGLWEDAFEETLILEGRSKNLWAELDNRSITPPTDDSLQLWREVGEETIVLTKSDENVWEKASGRPGFEEMQPNRQLGYAIKRFTTARGEVYYILKNLRENNLLRLNDRQYFIWNLIDGENSIQDIAVAYMTEFGSLDIRVLTDLLGMLEAGNFLTSPRTNFYEQLTEKISGRSPIYWLKQAAGLFLQKEFPIPGMDNFYTRTYNGGIKYFYTKPVLAIILILAVTGMSAFIYLLAVGRYSIFYGATSSLGLGVIVLYLANMLGLFIHEGGHAYTCKHYGRDIRKSGVMIYYGAFAFYVDTTDIWMESRLPRIMVSFGGPLTGFVIGGVASLIALFSPWEVFNGWSFQFAFLIVLDSVMNLNPLMKWDGYYILMDLLEMPNLRKRSFQFMQSGKVVTKLFKREKYSREELVLSIYGIISFLYTAAIMISFFVFFGETMLNFIARFINPILLIPILLIIFLFMSRKQIKNLVGFIILKLRPRATKS